MRFVHLENNILYKRSRQAETERLKKKLNQISNRSPLYTKNSNIPVLPIINSSKVARINKQKKLETENQKMKQRIEAVSKQKSEYSYRVSEQLDRSRDKSPHINTSGSNKEN